MTSNEFLAVCGEHLIAPEIALENETIREALRNRASQEEIARLLEQEF